MFFLCYHVNLTETAHLYHLFKVLWASSRESFGCAGHRCILGRARACFRLVV